MKLQKLIWKFEMLPLQLTKIKQVEVLKSLKIKWKLQIKKWLQILTHNSVYIYIYKITLMDAKKKKERNA